ncbi:hypothetical protein BGX31_000153 [Mortierella sp. GBA43]|nr:hypothetical protein BGX31_000153 [Mortierella sp. GBA43]
MTEHPNPSKKPTTAIMFIGNMGLHGGPDQRDIRTSCALERPALMDVPGLYEDDDEITQANAKKLTAALEKGYDYKLFFMLMAHPRGFYPEDLALMSHVNKCVRQANNTKVDFRVIINQIHDDKEYKMYEERVAQDNFQKAFGSPRFQKHHLDIKVNDVMLVRFGNDESAAEQLEKDLPIAVETHVATPIKLEGDIMANNVDITTFDDLAMEVAMKVTMEVIAITAVGLALALCL